MHQPGHPLGRLLASFILTLSIGLSAPIALAAEKGSDPADVFPPEQIEQLVAPIALYPDALIAQILMASTYPLDVVQAQRWLEDHADLEGEALDQAVNAEPWDDSVKTLVFFPSVLTFMNDNLDWTQDLGDAVLAQQGEVTDTIQRLRAEADQAGALASTEQQRVEKAGDTIIIQPAQPEVVYVPTYDPVAVYGESSPPAQSYYPDAYADAAASYQSGFAAGQAAEASDSSGVSSDSLVGFGVGALAGGLLTAAIMWDDDDDWNDRLYYGGPGYYGAPSYWSRPNYWSNNGWREPTNINVERNRNIDLDRTVERGDINVNRGIVGNEVTKWEHNPERRGGVRYRDSSTQNRFVAQRGESTIDRDAARGRLTSGDRPVKAPNLDQVRREGAASGKVGELAANRPAAAQARAQVQAKAPAIKSHAKPKAQVAAATQRPVNREVARPAVAQVKRPSATQVQRPAVASKPLAQRPAASRASAPKTSAFAAGKPAVSRAASNRGGASRAAAGQRAGAVRGSGGLRR